MRVALEKGLIGVYREGLISGYGDEHADSMTNYNDPQKLDRQFGENRVDNGSYEKAI
jgi:hypothetical protein